jgi:hypothetical protein
LIKYGSLNAQSNGWRHDFIVTGALTKQRIPKLIIVHTFLKNLDEKMGQK